MEIRFNLSREDTKKLIDMISKQNKVDNKIYTAPGFCKKLVLEVLSKK